MLSSVRLDTDTISTSLALNAFDNQAPIPHRKKDFKSFGLLVFEDFKCLTGLQIH